jgi:hypothetical protein
MEKLWEETLEEFSFAGAREILTGLRRHEDNGLIGLTGYSRLLLDSQLIWQQAVH